MVVGGGGGGRGACMLLEGMLYIYEVYKIIYMISFIHAQLCIQLPNNSRPIYVVFKPNDSDS